MAGALAAASLKAPRPAKGLPGQCYRAGNEPPCLAVRCMAWIHRTSPGRRAGAIVIYAALQLVDLPTLRQLAAFRRTELAIDLATCIGVLAFSILYGVLVAIGCRWPTC